MNPAQFTLRVYGLLRDRGRVLVSDEWIKGKRITKFPGGGLQYGEGLSDALVREIKEEMMQEAMHLEHFYTTDFFQQSTFHSEPMQVISVYYTFQVKNPASITVAERPFHGLADRMDQEIFRWLDLTDNDPDAVTLPIDKVVLRLLKEIR